MKIRRSIINGIMAFGIFVLVLMSADAIRLRNLLKDYPEVNVPTLIPSGLEDLPPIVDSDHPEITCEFVDVLKEEIEFPDDAGDVQEIIGYQNNKVGLYSYAEIHDYVEVVETLANSNGGDWGYILLPYNVKDYNEQRWGSLFELLGEKHLIPIVQLWDLELEDVKEQDKQIRKSANFLNTLQWPIKNRYISVYNEPNDAKFWKGKVNPQEYAEVLNDTIKTFKILDSDFFVMNGALNASARTGGDYLDAETFMIRMNQQVPGIFAKLDGWASHPYPQPNFSGSPKGSGRDSIRAYEWELDILRSRFGVTNIPVFITETGWAHKEDARYNEGDKTQYALDEYQVADNIRYAFENVWLPDERVVAVTPFTIRYDPPFDNFSWLRQDNEPYPQYLSIQDMEKTEGKPPIVKYYKTQILECD